MLELIQQKDKAKQKGQTWNFEQLREELKFTKMKTNVIRNTKFRYEIGGSGKQVFQEQG